MKLYVALVTMIFVSIAVFIDIEYREKNNIHIVEHRDFHYTPLVYYGDSYLTYNPAGGISMQTRCLTEALVFAYKLNRILIVPDFYETYEGKSGLDPSTVIDFEFLQSRVEMLGVHVLRKKDAPFIPSNETHVIGPLTIGETSFLPLNNITQYDVPKKLIVFMWLFSYVKYETEQEKKLFHAIQASVRSSSIIRQSSELWLKNLRHYASTPECRNFHHYTKSRSGFVCIHLRIEKDFEETFKGPPSFIPLPEIRERVKTQMKRLFQAVGIRTLYIAGGIATKEWAGGMFPCIFNKEDVASFNDSLLQRHYLSSLPAIVDKEVCREADIFIGNRYSTFSESIVDWRMRHGSKRNEYPWLSLDYSGYETHIKPYCSANAKQYWDMDCDD